MRRILATALLGLLGVILVSSVSGTLIASAATGEATWVNPLENTGGILSDEGSTTYEFDFALVETNPQGWEPALDQSVAFTEAPGQPASESKKEGQAPVPGDPPVAPPCDPVAR
jgi:hypothetical protein